MSCGTSLCVLSNSSSVDTEQAWFKEDRKRNREELHSAQEEKQGATSLCNLRCTLKNDNRSLGKDGESV